jgi:hypothetical protein
MDKKIHEHVPEGGMYQCEGGKMIAEALEGFFKTSSGEVVEYLEKMLYEWYQHYALDHYQIEQINEMVNGVFRVNDLLLKLNDAMIALNEEKGIENGNLPSDHYDYRYAS